MEPQHQPCSSKRVQGSQALLHRQAENQMVSEIMAEV
jgi:hypothetical protein